MNYTIIVEKGREHDYIAFCPILRGCVSQGKTRKEAVDNLKLAIKDYIECLVEDGLSIPTEIGKETVRVAVTAK